MPFLSHTRFCNERLVISRTGRQRRVSNAAANESMRGYDGTIGSENHECGCFGRGAARSSQVQNVVAFQGGSQVVRPILQSATHCLLDLMANEQVLDRRYYCEERGEEQ